MKRGVSVGSVLSHMHVDELDGEGRPRVPTPKFAFGNLGASVSQLATSAFQRKFSTDSFDPFGHPQEQTAAFEEDEEFRRNILGRIAEKNVNLFEENSNVITEAWMVHPDSLFRRVWNLVTMLLVIVLLFWIPFDLGFNFSPSAGGSPTQQFWFAVDWSIDIFFVLDILLNFRTAVVDDGELLQKPRLVASRYLRGWFWLDIIATIPYDRFVELALDGISGRQATFAKLPRLLRFLRLLRLMRLMRLLKVGRILDQWEELGMLANSVWRVARIVFWMVAVGHILGCGWFFMADLEGLGDDTWAGPFALDTPETTFTDKYTISVYWAFVTVTTVGYGDVVPESKAERQFVIVCTFIGNLVFAYMIGKFTAMASRVDAAGQIYQAKLDEVNEFMRFHQLPKKLRKRVRTFYETYWSQGVYFNERTVLSELSFSLRRDVDFYLKREIITKVPFFQDADANFVSSLIQHLAERFCAPDETIIEIGEVGREMYILKRGEVVVIDAQGEPSHHLGDGAFFGEVALLDPTLKRTASIRSVTACDLYSLTKADMDEVLMSYPDFRDAMLAIAEIRLRQTQVTSDMLTPAAMDAMGTSPTAGSAPRGFGDVDAIVAMAMGHNIPTPGHADEQEKGADETTPKPKKKARGGRRRSMVEFMGALMQAPGAAAAAGGDRDQNRRGSTDMAALAYVKSPNRTRRRSTSLGAPSDDDVTPKNLAEQKQSPMGALARRRGRQHGRGSLVGTMIAKDMSRLYHAAAAHEAAREAGQAARQSSKPESEGDGSESDAESSEGKSEVEFVKSPVPGDDEKAGPGAELPGTAQPAALSISPNGLSSYAAKSSGPEVDMAPPRQLAATKKVKVVPKSPSPQPAAQVNKSSVLGGFSQKVAAMSGAGTGSARIKYKPSSANVMQPVQQLQNARRPASNAQQGGGKMTAAKRFQKKAKELLMKHRVARAMGMTAQTRYEQARSQYDRAVLGRDDGVPDPDRLRSVGQRLELLEAAMMDIVSKLDALMVAQRIAHPTVRGQRRRSRVQAADQDTGAGAAGETRK